MSYSKEKNKQYLNERYKKQREFFKEFLGSECAKCRSVENLQFDHINPKEKLFNVGRLWPNKDIPKVLEELKKCQLLCESCHIEKSAKESSERMNEKYNGFSHGTFYGWMKKRCECDLCFEAKAKFHKERNIKRRIKGGYGARPRKYF
jgi:hypothetical protein